VLHRRHLAKKNALVKLAYMPSAKKTLGKEQVCPSFLALSEEI